LLNAFNRSRLFQGRLHRPSTRHKLWPDVERAVIDGLKDKAIEIRFWACYAAGTLRMKSALPQLHALAKNDPAIYPGWWRGSEEAADAIEWIHGRDTETREHIPAQIKM
jgi:hypothetical protein